MAAVQSTPYCVWQGEKLLAGKRPESGGFHYKTSSDGSWRLSTITLKKGWGVYPDPGPPPGPPPVGGCTDNSLVSKYLPAAIFTGGAASFLAPLLAGGAAAGAGAAGEAAAAGTSAATAGTGFALPSFATIKGVAAGGLGLAKALGFSTGSKGKDMALSDIFGTADSDGLPGFLKSAGDLINKGRGLYDDVFGEPPPRGTPIVEQVPPTAALAGLGSLMPIIIIGVIAALAFGVRRSR